LKLKPTKEQEAVVSLAGSGETMSIDARSGCAKTSSLQMVADEVRYPTLYLAFNRTMADEAKSKFPEHVDVMTTHSLAYRNIGHKYRNKLQRPRGPWRNLLGTGKEVAMHFKIGTFEVGDTLIHGSTAGYAVVNTVNNFEHSADAEISEKHVSTEELRRKGIDLKSSGVVEYLSAVLEDARSLWELRKDLNNDALATHDTYLKLYQLSEPDLTDKYDVIMLDESQDTNASVLDIFRKQDTQRIAVGDSLQNIYSWRGARNALSLLPWTKRELTQSFRFGPELAELARLMVLDEDWLPYIELKGTDTLDTKVVDSSYDMEGPITHIYRTNGALLLAALKHIEDGKQVRMEVETTNFKRKLFSAMALRQDRRGDIKHPDILLFETWDEFVEDGEFRDPENRHIANVINYGHFHRVVSLLEDYHPSPNPESIFITAHKSKGLEWDNVVLGDDFRTVIRDDLGNYKYTNYGERNLLYVAVTRARKRLVPNADVRTLESLARNSMSVSSNAH